MFKCPNCNESAVSLWQKFNMTHEKRVSCKKCGREIGVSKKAAHISQVLFYLILGLIVFFVPRYAANNLQVFLYDIVLAVIYILIQFFVIPLTAEE